MPTIFCRLASPDRFAKDIGVFAVVISQLEFSDIERQIFLVHFMGAADDATLEGRPEALDDIRVDVAVNVFPRRVSENFVWIFGLEPAIAPPFVSGKQAQLVRHGLVDEGRKHTQK